ncbi:MAG: hypothetical protein AAF602_05700 [Myxococcota bacterium]
MVLWLAPLAVAQVAEVRQAYVDDLPVWVDFVDELRPQGFTVQSVVDLSSGVRRVTLSVVVRNHDGAQFDAAVAVPDFEAAMPAWAARTVQAAEFSAITPATGASPQATSIVDAVVEADPGVDVDALVDALDQGQIPVRVWGQEVPQLRDDITLWGWTEVDAAAYEVADNVPTDPFGPPPWDPADTYTMRLYYALGAPPELLDVDLATDVLYFRPALQADLSLLPEGFHYFVADSRQVEDLGTGQLVTITGRVTDAEDLKAIYEYATFSTSPDGQIGSGPVGGTRIPELDGDEVPREERDGWSAPVPFNDVPLLGGAVTASGQVHVSALKPSISLRIRPGDTELTFRFESEATLAAQLRAIAGVEDEDEVTLGESCFPLPPLRFGPVKLPMRLHLEHLLTVETGLEAGMILDFQHRVTHAYTITCFDSGVGGVCSHESEMTPRPFQVTPPQLTPTLGAYGQVGTELATTLWIGGPPWPDCDNGFRATLRAGLYGRLDVRPLEDPWFQVTAGHSLEGTFAIEALGESIVDYEVGGVLEVHPDALLAAAGVPDPLDLARHSSGEDQRWMVVVDQVEVDNPVIEQVAAASLSNGDLVLTAWGSAGDARMLMHDPFGDRVDLYDFFAAPNRRPEAIVITSDDTVLVGGFPAWMAVFEPNDQPLWARAYEITDGTRPFTAEINGLEGVESDVFWLGHLARGPQDDAVIVKLTEAGDIVWAKIYEGDGRQQLHAATRTADGDLVVVGTTETGPDPFSLDNAWMMRIDPEDGEVIWSRAIVSTRRQGWLTDVVEGPDGDLYAVGYARRDVTRTAAGFVTKVEPDGSDAIHAMLIATDGDVWIEEDLGPYLPQAYDTAYDALTSLAVVEDSVVVVGHAGNVDRTAWMASLGSRLDPEWFVTLDSEGADTFTHVHAVPGGLVVAGHTTAPVWGNDGSEAFPFLAKVPLGGGLALADDVTGLELHYLMPGVRDTSGSLDIVPGEQVLYDAPVNVVDATVREVIDVMPTELVEAVPEPACTHLLTVTGRPTTTDPCPDVDRLPPVVRIVSPAPASYPASEPVPIELVMTDEVGVVRSTVRLDGAEVDLQGPVVVTERRLEPGPHRLDVEAEDAAGHVSQATVTFDVVEDAAGEVEDVPTPTDPPLVRACGCGSTGGGSAWWIGLMTLVAFRRRDYAGVLATR